MCAMRHGYSTGSGSDRVLAVAPIAENPVATAPGTVPADAPQLIGRNLVATAPGTVPADAPQLIGRRRSYEEFHQQIPSFPHLAAVLERAAPDQGRQEAGGLVDSAADASARDLRVRAQPGGDQFEAR